MAIMKPCLAVRSLRLMYAFSVLVTACGAADSLSVYPGGDGGGGPAGGSGGSPSGSGTTVAGTTVTTVTTVTSTVDVGTTVVGAGGDFGFGGAP